MVCVILGLVRINCIRRSSERCTRWYTVIGVYNVPRVCIWWFTSYAGYANVVHLSMLCHSKGLSISLTKQDINNIHVRDTQAIPHRYSGWICNITPHVKVVYNAVHTFPIWYRSGIVHTKKHTITKITPVVTYLFGKGYLPIYTLLIQGVRRQNPIHP